MYNITSTSISYRALRDFMQEALADTPASTFARPPGLKEVEICTPSGMKADEDCGRKVKTILSEENLPKEDDNWWRKAKIDIRDGLLATELTPPQFVQERYDVVIPDTVTGFARSQAQEWLRYLNVGTVTEQRSTGEAPVRIDKPKNGANVKNVVEITGKADDPQFQAYRLEFGSGSPPLEWTTLLRSETPQPDGGLGLWNVKDLADGTYTLRLVLETKDRGELSTFVVVTVGKGEVREVTPVPSPTFPPIFGGN
jgi:hypothetical protein